MEWVPKRNAHKRDVLVNIDQVFEGKELGTLKSTISFYICTVGKQRHMVQEHIIDYQIKEFSLKLMSIITDSRNL